VGSSRARARRVTLLLGRRGGTWAPGALLRYVRMRRNVYAAAGKVKPPALEGAQEPSEAAQTPAPPRMMRRFARVPGVHRRAQSGARGGLASSADIPARMV
jgi:hypothetical protein